MYYNFIHPFLRCDMKHLIRNMLFFLFLSSPCLLSAETISLTTYYPAPFGSYSVLRLNPNSDASMGVCDASKNGQIYLSSDSNEIKFCNGTSWGSTSSWIVNSALKYVYQNNTVTDTAYKVGIGIATPTARMHVKGIDDAASGQLRVESTGSEAKLTLMNSNGAATTGLGSIGMSNTASAEGMRFMINGADKMIVDEYGNLGIGLTEPNTRLHISGPDSDDYGQLKISSTGNNAKIALYNADGPSATGRAHIMMSRSAGAEGLRFLINNIDKMIIDENGNVGIGYTTPSELLSVSKDQAGHTAIKVSNFSGAVNSGARMNIITSLGSQAILDLTENGAGSTMTLFTGDNVTGGMYFTSGDTVNNIPIFFTQGGVERMRVHSDGNVGIGVPAPVQKLDVAGGLHLSGPISGNLDSVNPASSGELQVDCQTTPGKCYAVYAP